MQLGLTLRGVDLPAIGYPLPLSSRSAVKWRYSPERRAYHAEVVAGLQTLLQMPAARLTVVDSDFTAAEGGGHLGFVQFWLLDIENSTSTELMPGQRVLATLRERLANCTAVEQQAQAQAQGQQQAQQQGQGQQAQQQQQGQEQGQQGQQEQAAPPDAAEAASAEAAASPSCPLLVANATLVSSAAGFQSAAPLVWDPAPCARLAAPRAQAAPTGPGAPAEPPWGRAAASGARPGPPPGRGCFPRCNR